MSGVLDEFKGERFSLFLASESKERFYLKQKWNVVGSDDKYLELMITDGTCYWTGSCKLNSLFNQTEFLELKCYCFIRY